MPSFQHHSGFTLIETMVTVSVLAILLTIGIPSFADVMRNNQIAAQTNNLVTALNTARSEASKRGMPVAVCASADATQSTCSASASDWTRGWIVFSDGASPGTAGQIDVGPNGDTILQRTGAPAAQLQVVTDVAFARFNANGERMNAPGGGPAAEMVFEVSHAACTGDNLRRVRINRTGRVSMTKVACP